MKNTTRNNIIFMFIVAFFIFSLSSPLVNAADKDLIKTILEVHTIDEEKGKEICKDAFESYFKDKFNSDNADIYIRYQYNSNMPHVDCWEINYKFKKDTEEFKKFKNAYAYIDSHTGEVKQIGLIEKVHKRAESSMKENEGKDLAIKYICDNELVEDINKLEYLGTMKLNKNLYSYSFKYEENNAINVGMSSVTKNINYFKYLSEKEAKILVKSLN